MNNYDKKNIQLRQLYNINKDCNPCIFGKIEHNHKVFGEGSPLATLMFIGEAPGADEDRLKRPFVGRSGKLLDKIFHHLGFSRNDVYITNIVKCRPPNNKTPLPEEITPEAKKLLKDEISIIRPHVICTLGAVSTQLFFKHPIKMSQVRGQQIQFEASKIILLPSFHPAYALRNKDAEKDLFNDILEAHRISKIDN